MRTGGRTHHLVARLLAVHEALRDDVGSEQLVALPELLEEDAVGEALPTDADALQHPVAAQLVEHERRVDLPALRTHETGTQSERARRQTVPVLKCISIHLILTNETSELSYKQLYIQNLDGCQYHTP